MTAPVSPGSFVARFAVAFAAFALLGIGALQLPAYAHTFATAAWMQAVTAAVLSVLAGRLAFARDTPVSFVWAGTLVIGAVVPWGLAGLVGLPPLQSLPILLGVAGAMSVLESGALRPVRCPDSQRVGKRWEFRRCDCPELRCNHRRVHLSQLRAGRCLACVEELEVRARMSQPREPAPVGKRCDLTGGRGTPDDPVETCYCGEAKFSKSQYEDGFCPRETCSFSKSRKRVRDRTRGLTPDGEAGPAHLG